MIKKLLGVFAGVMMFASLGWAQFPGGGGGLDASKLEEAKDKCAEGAKVAKNAVSKQFGPWFLPFMSFECDPEAVADALSKGAKGTRGGGFGW